MPHENTAFWKRTLLGLSLKSNKASKTSRNSANIYLRRSEREDHSTHHSFNKSLAVRFNYKIFDPWDHLIASKPDIVCDTFISKECFPSNWFWFAKTLTRKLHVTKAKTILMSAPYTDFFTTCKKCVWQSYNTAPFFKPIFRTLNKVA